MPPYRLNYICFQDFLCRPAPSPDSKPLWGSSIVTLLIKTDRILFMNHALCNYFRASDLPSSSWFMPNILLSKNFFIITDTIRSILAPFDAVWAKRISDTTMILLFGAHNDRAKYLETAPKSVQKRSALIKNRAQTDKSIFLHRIFHPAEKEKYLTKPSSLTGREWAKCRRRSDCFLVKSVI